ERMTSPSTPTLSDRASGNMRYQPLADRIIVEMIDDKRITGGGLFVPDVATVNKFMAFGTVVAHGNGRVNSEGKTVPLSVKAGMIIAFPRREAAPIPIMRDDGSEFELHLLREAQVIAIVHDLPRASKVLDVSGAPLSIMPTSRGLPDVAYENRDALDRSEFELRAAGAPPEVIEEHTDEPYEH
ncbi:MAG: co-chaperone GroES family protein, partial [Tepidisphaeraceae bacterium]